MKVQSHAELRAYYEKDAQDVTSMFDAMLALSVIISIFGVVNTLALSVLERTREIGLLRAVGGSRRQVRRMVRSEGILTTLIGATLGLALGVFLAGLTTAAIEGAQFSVPYGQLLVMGVIAYVLGVIAAVAPARRATRAERRRRARVRVSQRPGRGGGHRPPPRLTFAARDLISSSCAQVAPPSREISPRQVNESA